MSFKIKHYMSFFSILLILLLIVACSPKEDSSTEEQDSQENGLPTDYPAESIEVLVGYAPGGSTDINARQMAKIIESEGIVDQSFVVKNVPGANGVMMAKEAHKKNDDPYTLQVVPDFAEGAWLSEEINPKDFSPISAIASSDIYVIVKDDSPYETIEDLLDSLKTKDDLTISLDGTVDGGSAYAWDQIAEQHDIKKLNFVTSDGGAESIAQILSGQDDVGLGLPAVVGDYIETGEIRPLAVLSEERSDLYPEIPTIKEHDIDVIYQRVIGLWAGGDVSDDVVDFWEKKTEELVNTDAWNDFLEEKSLTEYFLTSEEFTDYVETEGPKYVEYVENLNK